MYVYKITERGTISAHDYEHPCEEVDNMHKLFPIDSYHKSENRPHIVNPQGGEKSSLFPCYPCDETLT